MTCGTKRCGLHCAEEMSLLQVNHDDCQKSPLLAALPSSGLVGVWHVGAGRAASSAHLAEPQPPSSPDDQPLMKETLTRST